MLEQHTTTCCLSSTEWPPLSPPTALTSRTTGGTIRSSSRARTPSSRLSPSKGSRSPSCSPSKRRKQKQSNQKQSTTTTSPKFYEVRDILDHRILMSSTLEVQISWEGHPDPTWEPIENTTQSADLIHKYFSLLETRDPPSFSTAKLLFPPNYPPANDPPPPQPRTSPKKRARSPDPASTRTPQCGPKTSADGMIDPVADMMTKTIAPTETHV